MGLKAYVDDDAVTEKLSEYGEIKSPVIRLKYKQGHEPQRTRKRKSLATKRTHRASHTVFYSYRR